MSLAQVSDRVGDEIAREQQHGKERQKAQKFFVMRQLHSSNGYVKSEASQPMRRRDLKEGSGTKLLPFLDQTIDFTMKSLSKQERAIAKAYEATRAKRLGNLHQRMKFLIKALEAARGRKTSEPDTEFDDSYRDIVHGISELETEVKFYQPAKPPYAKRGIPFPHT